jgi:nucleoside 2-deoxyribosyltransferase
MKKMYLAAPFFTPSQIKTVELMEAEIEKAGFELLSPRRSGVLMDMSPSERAASARRIFVKNCEDITASDYLLALVDDRDPGTIWEMGFCTGIGGRLLFTYTEHDYDLNVMIKGSVAGHARGPTELRGMLDDIFNGWTHRLWKYSPNLEKVF